MSCLAPACRLRLSLGAKPPLAFQDVDLCTVIPGAPRQVIYLLTTSVDIAFDTALRHAACGNGRVAMPVLPRRDKCTGPDARVSLACLLLLADIRVAVLPVGERPAVFDHKGVQVEIA